MTRNVATLQERLEAKANARALQDAERAVQALPRFTKIDLVTGEEEYPYAYTQRKMDYDGYCTPKGLFFVLNADAVGTYNITLQLFNVRIEESSLSCRASRILKLPRRFSLPQRSHILRKLTFS